MGLDYGKLYVGKKRVHHGLIGFYLLQWSKKIDNEFLRIGVEDLALLFMKDDILDIHKWFRMSD